MSDAPTDELDDVADALYSLRPDGFVAARDDRVKQAREQGQPSLAREIAKLKRPTQSAWLVNLLWRDQREVVEQLLELGEGLREAHEQASGAELQRLSAERRKVEAGLIRRVRKLASDAGVDVTADMAREAEETLAAAMVRPEVADDVRAGRVVKPVSYSGFGALLSVVPEPVEKPRRRTDDGGSTRDGDEVDRRREDAERRAADAREDLAAAEAELADRTSASDAASQRADELGERLADLRAQIRQVEDELADAERAARTEGRQLVQAERSRDRAELALTRAEERLQDL
ncbi:MAG: hypothetical protein ACRDWI_07570 [Jiangellaceae bacterium]